MYIKNLVEFQAQGKHFNKCWLLFLFDSSMWSIGPLKSSDIYSRAAEEKKQKWMPKYAKNKKPCKISNIYYRKWCLILIIFIRNEPSEIKDV